MTRAAATGEPGDGRVGSYRQAVLSLIVPCVACLLILALTTPNQAIREAAVNGV